LISRHGRHAGVYAACRHADVAARGFTLSNIARCLLRLPRKMRRSAMSLLMIFMPACRELRCHQMVRDTINE